MEFDCSNYQHQFRERLGAGSEPRPLKEHVFQTIFLNEQQKDMWTWNEIDSSKIIARKWSHQLRH